MQAKDCAWMCTQVMEANREETSLSAHLYGFYHPAALPNNAPQTEKLSSQSLGHRRYCLLRALILSFSSVILDWIIAGERQAHTWGGWVAFLGTEWHLLRLKAWVSSATRLCKDIVVQGMRRKSWKTCFPKTAIGYCLSYGNIKLVVVRLGLNCCIYCSSGEMIASFLSGQKETIVIVRLNRTLQVCTFFKVKHGTEPSSWSQCTDNPPVLSITNSGFRPGGSVRALKQMQQNYSEPDPWRFLQYVCTSAWEGGWETLQSQMPTSRSFTSVKK